VIALDTNVIARYLLGDDETQFASAAKLIEGKETCTAPVTVFLELVWVLESYDIERLAVVKNLRGFLGLPNIKPHQPQVLAKAINSYENGLDFGDALHLALCEHDSYVASFDDKFVKRAKKLSLSPAVVKL
jgi:predicted nucleic acid-binding protein